MSKKVKIILNTSLRQLGKMGDEIFVKMGYFMNYLKPKNYASIYSAIASVEIQRKKESENKQLDDKRKEAIKIAEYIETNHLSFIAQASGTGVLYGSIEKKQIKKELEKMINYSVRAIEITQAIKKTGIHHVVVDIFEDVHAKLTILVATSDGNMTQLESELKKSVVKK